MAKIGVSDIMAETSEIVEAEVFAPSGATHLHPAVKEVEVTGEPAVGGSSAEVGESSNKSKYPLKVQYCKVCMLPAEVHEYLSVSQFKKYVLFAAPLVQYVAFLLY